MLVIVIKFKYNNERVIFMNSMIIYQLSFRAMTPEGTINAAAKMLPYIKSLGVTWVYIAPVWKADDSMDESSWSPRQRASGCGNPKNPYKMVDYFNVDEEYGTNEDLMNFVTEAHKIGLKVMFDLVYLHCGVNAVFLKDHPDWIIRNEDGTPLIGEGWPFARINYDNFDVREYLYTNMETFVRDYGCDGFRCDVGDVICMDFWAEARKRVHAINKNVILLDEGVKPEYVHSGVFDLQYRCLAFPFGNKGWLNILNAENKTEAFKRAADSFEKSGCKHINLFENHDFASDSKLERLENILTPEQVESCYFIVYTVPGVPFIWNGNEIADKAEQCMFSNRFYGKRIGINWANALREEGIERMEYIEELNAMRKDYPMLFDAELKIISPKKSSLIVFERTKGDKKILVLVNLSDKKTKYERAWMEFATEIAGRRYEFSGKKAVLDGFGFVALEIKR